MFELGQAVHHSAADTWNVDDRPYQSLPSSASMSGMALAMWPAVVIVSALW